jgi:hypothetical protein
MAVEQIGPGKRNGGSTRKKAKPNRRVGDAEHGQARQAAQAVFLGKKRSFARLTVGGSKTSGLAFPPVARA